MENGIFLLLLSLVCSSLFSCLSNKNEPALTQKDIQFIRGLGILNEQEDIEVFESNGGWKGMKESGNFITSERIAHYWVKRDQREIESAYFANEIDSLTLTDLVSKLTYASYLTVYKKDGHTFNVYVDADSTRTYQFFQKAQNNLAKYRARP